jgi:2',3'-cyclic-nucleotide 2'-phosphodiesterase (5'-nucleotidase family)
LIKDYALNSSLGNLITNIVANGMKKDLSIKFDFVVVNGGGFRTTWYPGVIRYG